MTFSNKVSILALLCLASNAAWSEQVNFCKTKTIYDHDINVPTKFIDEDCSGVAFLWYAKDLVKASCWEGATNLHEGKCEAHKEDDKDATTEPPEIGAEEAEK
jgi:hypothetical protein